MTTGLQHQHAAFLAAAERALWRPADHVHRAQLSDIFKRLAPLEIDFGCGDGSFLLAMASRFPERNFLGTERLLGRIEKVSRAIARNHLENCRILRLESNYAAKWLLPVGCASVVHIGFPDPWPKRHHHPRRLFQDEFMVSLHQVLATGGEVRIKTDDQPYFLWIEKVIARAKGFERIEWNEESDYPKTDFEQHFVAQGLP
ncbi:MAG: tRNA (guanosine(46)-N7)-methyltransferase TrmB, partial [Chthoniobacteraceae bacterium]